MRGLVDAVGACTGLVKRALAPCCAGSTPQSYGASVGRRRRLGRSGGCRRSAAQSRLIGRRMLGANCKQALAEDDVLLDLVAQLSQFAQQCAGRFPPLGWLDRDAHNTSIQDSNCSACGLCATSRHSAPHPGPVGGASRDVRGGTPEVGNPGRSVTLTAVGGVGKPTPATQASWARTGVSDTTPSSLAYGSGDHGTGRM